MKPATALFSLAMFEWLSDQYSLETDDQAGAGTLLQGGTHQLTCCEVQIRQQVGATVSTDFQGVLSGDSGLRATKVNELIML